MPQLTLLTPDEKFVLSQMQLDKYYWHNKDPRIQAALVRLSGLGLTIYTGDQEWALTLTGQQYNAERDVFDDVSDLEEEKLMDDAFYDALTKND